MRRTLSVVLAVALTLAALGGCATTSMGVEVEQTIALWQASLAIAQQGLEAYVAFQERQGALDAAETQAQIAARQQQIDHIVEVIGVLIEAARANR